MIDCVPALIAGFRDAEKSETERLIRFSIILLVMINSGVGVVLWN